MASYITVGNQVFLLTGGLVRPVARATLEILIPDFVKQTSEEKPVEGDELEVTAP